MEPDKVSYQKFWKNISKADKLKESAAEEFKKGTSESLENALKIYNECLELDKMNSSYNIGILFNVGCTLHSLKKYDDALSTFNKVIYMDKEHAKAYIKRSDILLK